MLIGREYEIATLRGLMTSDESQFVAVYGRRRVGKTFLIREVYKTHFVFQHTGTYGATRRQQLSDFRESLYLAGMGKCAMPKTWSEAFGLLWAFLKAFPENEEKKVIFIDELPWMDTPKSNFVRSLDHFWNAWASTRKDLILVICGSATSWIIDNVVMNYGFTTALPARCCCNHSPSESVSSIAKQRAWATRTGRSSKPTWLWEESHTIGVS